MQITTDRPFRGSSALASGSLTRGTLYGPGYRRLYPDIHIDAKVELDLEVWSRAAHELVAPCGVLAGYSAAELHGASCAPPGAPAEVLLLDGYRRRAGPMLVVRLDAITRDEITEVDGIRLTSPERTAADLARWAPSLTEAVVAVDVLSATCRFDPVLIIDAVEPGARGSARLPQVVALADRGSQSPMETRIRLAIVLAGLPPPVSQHPVVLAGREFALDLATPMYNWRSSTTGPTICRPTAHCATSSVSSSWLQRGGASSASAQSQRCTVRGRSRRGCARSCALGVSPRDQRALVHPRS